jgi:hypothetical protein
MGASSSIPTTGDNIRLKDNMYISYAYNDKNAETFHDELLNSGYNILQANFHTEKDDFSLKEYQELTKQIMEQSLHIFICVSEKTVTSFHQAIEINIALDSKKNIVYIFTDENFTPANTHYLNGLVSYNIWLPAYDAITIITAIETLESFNILQ